MASAHDASECGIYEIVNLVNGKRYVGSARLIRRRWAVHRHHLRKGNHHSFILQRAWRKHGELSFDFRVIEECQVEALISREQHHIERLTPEYNVAKQAGGGGGPMSEAAKNRLRDSNRRRTGTKHSAETRKRISEAKLGNRSTRGRKQSPEHIEKRAAANRGKKRSTETRARIAAKATGRKFVRFNDDYRAKLSAASKGRMPSPEHMEALQTGRRSRIYTDEQRAKMAAQTKARWAERGAEAFGRAR